MPKIQLPACGMFVGTGVYPTDTDTLLSTTLGHYTWQTQYLGSLEHIDKIIEDNQGNLAQVWGIPRGFSPKLIADWLYALDEIGISIPAPDWDNYKNLTTEEYKDVFEQHKDRFGAGLVRFIREAKKRGLYTCFIYTNSAPGWVPEMSREGGEFYLGYDFGERYTFSLDEARELLATEGKVSLSLLTDSLIRRVREHVGERHRAGWGNVMATSSNFHLDYEIYGGADVPVVEDFAFTSLNLASGLSRGLYRQYDLPLWGSHLAHEHYSWLPVESPYRWHQLEAAYFLKYMAGSKMIINESGNWFVEHTLSPDSPKFDLPQTAAKEFKNLGWGASRELMAKEPKRLKKYLDEARPYFGKLDYTSPVCKKYREITSKFWDFVKENGTPSGQPETTLGLIKGNYDLTTCRFTKNYGIAGMSEIADTNPSWYQGFPEQSWGTVEKVFYPLKNINGKYKNLHVSGTPFGQVDLVSFAKDNFTAEYLLKQYKGMIFTGWNTCSQKQYDELVKYVRGGGILFTSIPHLCTNDTRNFAYATEELVNGGDFSELCGVKVRSKGERFYWATIPLGESRLGLKFPRRFGIMGSAMGNIEITDPELEVLACDDETENPFIACHKLGKGEVYFLNSWAYPGAVDSDDGPGGTLDSPGIVGYLWRYIANKCRGNVYITEQGTDQPGAECEYVAFSHFPEDGSICLFNVDYDNPHTFELHHFGETEAIMLNPGEFRLRKTT